MKLIVDAIAVRPGSAAIVISNLLSGWMAIAPDDQIIVLLDGPPEFFLPELVTVEVISNRRASVARRLWAQSVGVRRACRRLGADGLLSAITASAFLGSACRHAVIVHDLRHEHRPTQFSLLRRLTRKLVYGWSFRHADALICNSERTRRDLLARRPRLRSKANVVLWGADHAGDWRASGEEAGGYVLAFGQFANKNVDRVLHAWQTYTAGHSDAILRVCGLQHEARIAAENLVSELGIGQTVELLPWLADDAFASLFAGAAAVLLPSDFEGFGLPAIEALLLGVPVVVSTDPALLEVTGGHAVVAAAESADELARAIDRALNLTSREIAAGVAHARSFTWGRSALQIRSIMLETADRR